MKREYKRTLIILGVIILTLVNFLCFWIGYQNFLNPKLGEFEIYGLFEEKDLALNMSLSHHAEEYKVEIYQNQKLVYQKTSKDQKIILDNFYPDYGDTFEIKAIAYNKNKDAKESTNTYSYTYHDATLEKNQSHYLAEQKDLSLFILGFDYKESYTIDLFYQDNKIYSSSIQNENIRIPHEKIEGYSGRIRAYLKNSMGRIISTFNFYLNTPVVGNLKIESPDTNYKGRWDDLEITLKGGENANHFYANLYVGESLIDRFEVENIFNKVIIPASKLQENTEYHLLIEAVYEDYLEIAKRASLDFKIEAHETTYPVYVSHNPTFIKPGTKVSLESMTKDSEIYYTLDGTEPSESSNRYEKPLEILDNMTLKTYAVSKNRFDSAVNTYNFQVQDKDLVVYLSPSNQDGNYGHQETNFTTEMAMMNQIADVVETKLKENGVKVYRNNPHGDINTWLYQSNSVHADFHLAIHSNGSTHHMARGIEIYVDDETSEALSIASNIYENLWQIYDGNETFAYHRGVKYARGSLGEVNRAYLPCGALIEVAYHDEKNDATWMVQNIENIGQNIANSIISYYN